MRSSSLVVATTSSRSTYPPAVVHQRILLVDTDDRPFSAIIGAGVRLDTVTPHGTNW